MTNLFSTLKYNQATDKFNLVRIEPARFVNDDLTAIGGGKYTITLTGFSVSQVKENDTSLTLSTTGPLIGEYTYDESTSLLTIFPNAAPSTSNAIVVFYYLFYTSGTGSVVTEDPENSATSLRNYEPRISTDPVIENSIKNVLQGILTINGSNLSLINNSGDLNKYLSENDSWYNKQIKIWACIDSTENIQKIFEGSISSVSINMNNVQLNIVDEMAKFDVPAFMGDDKSETYITKDDYTNVYPNALNKAIPFMFGTVSRYTTIPETVTNLTTAQKIDHESLYESVCIDYTTNLTTSTNRTWIACRTSDGSLDFSCTPSNISNADANFTRIDVTAAQAAKFHIGDTFYVLHGVTNYPVRVYYVDRTNNYIYVTKEANIVTNDTIIANDMPTVVVSERETAYYLLYGRDYTITETATSGSNYIYTINLVNNFEANHAGLTILNPGVNKVLFRMKPDATNAAHGNVLKKLIESVGLTVNAASIAAANVTLSSRCNFSIPQFDETDFYPYYKYIELLLGSTFGCIFLNNSFEIEYKLFDTPSSSSTLTDNDILLDSFNMSMNYQDIVTQLIGYNPHYSSNEVTSLAATPSVTEVSNKAIYLHGINNTARFRHILEDMSSRLSDIMNFRSERLVIYNFSTATVNLDSLIGDDFKLEKTGLLGDDTSRIVTLIKVGKNTNSVSISAVDFVGV